MHLHQIACGMAYLHGRNVLHGDLKVRGARACGRRGARTWTCA